MLRGLPSTCTVILPLKYQPKEPVENSRLSAMTSCPLITTLTGSAFSMNWALVSGHGDFAMGPESTRGKRHHRRKKMAPRREYANVCGAPRTGGRAMTRTPTSCTLLTAFLLLACTDKPPPEVPPPPPAASPLGLAVASVGTAAALAGLRGLALEAAGTTSAWDEGTDPSEALIPSTSSEVMVAASLDVDGDRMRLAYQRKYLLIRPGTQATFTETIAGLSGYVAGDDRVTGDAGASHVARLSS